MEMTPTTEEHLAALTTMVVAHEADIRTIIRVMHVLVIGLGLLVAAGVVLAWGR